MKRDDLIAGLAARRLQSVEQRAEVIDGARRIGSVGEVLERLRDASRRRDGAAVLGITRHDRRDHQVLERREARLDLHPLASIPLAELIPTPGALIVHRLSGGAK